MSRFKKKGKKSLPPVSTASLPDIVFMLLFFFMVATVVKENDPKVQFYLPETKYTKLIEDRSSIGFIYVGESYDKEKGEGTMFELNSMVVNSVAELRALIRTKYGSLTDEEKSRYYFALKIDGDTKISEVNKVKKALQDEEALKIIYSTIKD